MASVKPGQRSCLLPEDIPQAPGCALLSGLRSAPCPLARINEGMLCACRAVLQEQLFLLSETFQPIILKLRQQCVALWRLRLHGVHAGRVYTLQALRDDQNYCMQASLVVHGWSVQRYGWHAN